MKIHAFRVVPRGGVTLAAVLEHLKAMPLADRLRPVTDVQMRLEEAVPLASGAWQVDFGLLKHDGPGRGSATQPITDFELEDDEGFGQETAGYYDPTSGFMTLQYNHYGARWRRIQGYLYRFARVLAGQEEVDELPETDHGFHLIPVIKAEASDRLEGMGIVKTVEFSFHVPGLRSRDRNESRSISSLLDVPLIGTAETVRLQISASRNRASSLAANHVRQVVADLLGAREDVTELSVTVKESEDAPSEPVDFLDARLQADIPVEGRPKVRPQ